MIKEININSKIFKFRFLNFSDINIHYFKLLSELTVIDLESISEEENKKFFDNLNENQKIIVIEFENNIIGSGTLLIENKLIRSYGKVGHIEDIVINSNFRKYGLGKELIKLLTDISKENKCYKCILDCDEHLEKFYIKCGFKMKGLQMSYYF